MPDKLFSITRQQLAAFIKDARTVRVFEQAIHNSNTLLPDQITQILALVEESSLNAGLADDKAAQALSSLESIAASLETLANARPALDQLSSDDLTPVDRVLKLTDLADVIDSAPAAGYSLVYDSTTKQWTFGDATTATATHAAVSKATPVDADELPLVDSAASWGLKKLTWANLKATLKTYFDALYQAASANLTAWAGKTAPSGTVVGTSDSQTLTNKTLTAAVLGGTTNVSGGRLQFPSTQSASANANTLDDYAEGTWTPTITASSGTFTSVSATGRYTKIGRLVTVQVDITITTVGTAAGGVNFTVPYTNGSYVTAGAGREVNSTGMILQTFLNAGSATANIFNATNGSPIGAGYRLTTTLSYTVDT